MLAKPKRSVHNTKTGIVYVEQDELLSSKTIENALGLVSRMFVWAMAPSRQYVTANPCEDIDVPDRGETEEPWTILSQEEIDQLFAYDLPVLQRAAFALAIYQGLRAGEQWGLKWDAVRLAGSRPELVVKASFAKTPKGKKVKTIPLLDPARDALEEDAGRHHAARSFSRSAPHHRICSLLCVLGRTLAARSDPRLPSTDRSQSDAALRTSHAGRALRTRSEDGQEAILRRWQRRQQRRKCAAVQHVPKRPHGSRFSGSSDGSKKRCNPFRLQRFSLVAGARYASWNTTRALRPTRALCNVRASCRSRTRPMFCSRSLARTCRAARNRPERQAGSLWARTVR